MARTRRWTRRRAGRWRTRRRAGRGNGRLLTDGGALLGGYKISGYIKHDCSFEITVQRCGSGHSSYNASSRVPRGRAAARPAPARAPYGPPCGPCREPPGGCGPRACSERCLFRASCGRHARRQACDGGDWCHCRGARAAGRATRRRRTPSPRLEPRTRAPNRGRRS